MRGGFPPSVRIVEVGPRDGLQSIPQLIPTARKVHFIDLLSDAALPEIEVTSFVSPKWVPQLGDGAKVFEAIKRRRLTIYTALVPNLRGLENALEAEFTSVSVISAASETFAQKNMNCTIDESIARLREMQPVWKENDLRVRGYVSTCWHCPYEGKVKIENVHRVVEQLFALGVDEISLGDTIGKAEPEEVKRLLDDLLAKWDVNDFALHMHDTHGKALANIKVGLEYGIRVFDASAAGIGGCPFAPGSSGNVATEALVQFCETNGVKTHIKQDKLTEAGDYIRSCL
ncbi:MAG: hydroxymethylglutaryl-CoA lyase [bacterium]|nr:hydroxymethylglutaryl-CoA lyase [bacterium]